jgi:phosphoglucosamine mutase
VRDVLSFGRVGRAKSLCGSVARKDLRILCSSSEFMSHTPKLFGTDGIRGEANRHPMDAPTAYAVGRALVHLMKQKSNETRIVIGRDTRVSGPMLQSALEAGVMSMGGYPCSVGVLPTPGIAFMTRSSGSDAGVVISASHNPFQDNGIKIFSGQGFKLSDEEEERMEAFILDPSLGSEVCSGPSIGRPSPLEEAEAGYVDFLKSSFPISFSMKGMKIVLDTANGATYRAAPHTFSGLEAEVEVIHYEPDGVNINDRCGSQHTESLQERVRASGADLGLAFDGDGDRLIAVDEKGRRLTGDQVLVIFAKVLKDLGELRNDLLVSTVMSNLGLRVACKRFGFRHHASNVGDRHVLEDMRRLGALVGGEESGHMIFLKHHTTGDGILAGVQLIASVIKEGKPLSELAGWMEVFPQKLINVKVRSKPDIEGVPALTEAIRDVEAALGEEGRVLVRYSGTEDLCRIMVEGPTHEITEKYGMQLADAVKTALG